MSRDYLPQIATHPDLPSVSQEKVLIALLSGSCVTSAAKAGGVDRATVHRWLATDAAFIAAYNSYRAEMVDAVRQEIRFLAVEATKAIRSVLTDEATPSAVKLKAAGEVLKMVLAEGPTGPKNVEDAEAALKRREMDRLLHRRPEPLV